MSVSLSDLAYTLTTGTLGYVVVILFLRVSGKRTLSKWNSFDFVITIAFGSILAALILAKEVTPFLQATLAFGLLVLYQFVLTWIAARSSVIQKLIKSEPSLLFYQGQFRNKTLKEQRIAEGEILAAIRSDGIGDMTQVGAVVLETDGSFSVIKSLENASSLKDVRGINQE
ncbi:DUF421 domain-containing protein [Sphaerothrix gracilis]|uniref:DUF421 domain-containing protein n=1 Tax=Sphaerothrix gracilis TaxID=3151835 RepID=UPI0031FD87BE